MRLINQEGFKDCGPTCLLMIIKHYKGNISINKLKEMCKTNKSGTTAYHLLETAKKCGFESNGYKCKLKDLTKENVILPCIAYVLLENTYQHYVVIEKINFDKKKIYIKDPIGKSYIKTFEEFEKIFQNILLYLYPVKKVINYKDISITKFIYKIILPSISQISNNILISIFITIFSIVSTFYMQLMIDNINTSKNKVYFIFLAFMLIHLFKITSGFLRNKLIILINKKIDLNLFLTTFQNIIHLPYRCYKNNTTGEIVSRINDLDNIRQLVSKVIISLFIDIPLMFVSVIIIYFLNKTLFFTSLIIIILYIFIYFIFKNCTFNYINECSDLKADVTSYMVESINSFDYVKGCNKEETIINKFEKKYVKFLNKISKYENINNIELTLKDSVDELGFLITTLIGILYIIEGKLNLVNLISFNYIFSYCTLPLKNLIELNTTFKHSLVSIRKVLNLYQETEQTGIIDSTLKGDIKFKNLSYSYNDVTNVLENINLDIKQGNKVMVTGKSGSGKSTLFKFLKKYYEVKRDTIYIDNIDINDYKKSDIVYISQNEFLFTDTILNNIDSNDIIKLSKICLLDEIIKDNPLGYNALIEENGFNFSGGEKQRIILARALSNHFNILIIDEGLNQVDTNMERVILKNLFKEYKDKTIIFITHRLKNMDLFNQILKIEEGRLINDERKN